MAISDVIRLMDEHPLDWEFEDRKYSDQIIKHPKANIWIQASFNYYDEVYKAKFYHKCKPKLGFWEGWRLLRAVRRLQRSKLNTTAANHLAELKRKAKFRDKAPSKCPYCKALAFGCIWICKCRAATHISCIKENNNQCPSCKYEADLEE
jgi:hypothetical protein